MQDTLTVILAGGMGSRLAPLTQDRAKPAVPFGGKYRIIDFTLSNCLHSGLRRLLVLTQYKSHSLQKHLRDGWSIFNPELGEYITAVPPQMRKGETWYEGTADAIYQNLWLLSRSEAKHVVVLSGDHIYRMDYKPMLKQHKETGAALTIACMEVPVEEASAFGVMDTAPNNQIISFLEKPSDPPTLADDPTKSLASMGIYIFSMDALVEALEEDAAIDTSSHDFGHDIIPKLIDTEGVYAHRFGCEEGRVSQDAYWRDVGTIDSFYQANMDLLDPVPPIDLYQDDWGIRSYERQRPPSRTVPSVTGNQGISINSIVANGVVISGGSVQRSILSSNVKVGDGATIINSILFDEVRIGEHCELQNCIIDKHVVVPDGTRIGYDAELDSERFTISEQGIVVVPEGYIFE
ncbi:glucose-1-phosphate adenylyltransferase [Vibrio breoganii]|uniref:glucose-1-phosphate adenylyltransferase n=1 Tax=Vibrio breoganii TaxID=553239 RepID=UPI000C82B951|nr:glucose-1-phosphate adenylyltransferase [Vibrio breoganii]MDN3715829.1 glucose-1-phosphate adenylyltransferase [Vibrio breoganii]PMG08019.1 glucose-1-phosphate adenylyltransferase [Vibrio breoganii]PMH15266.1 glucose-1-phosphate adenylyltransferase [Vibrio breoganii]PMM16386.1 glucose-1-phosphate adenylyltransferase [Vibrio breoganii]TKF90352.1 glucose-1-phosphate adenylyltransferase [Vibrio breoganii]